MGALNDVLVAAKTRLLAVAATSPYLNESNVRIVRSPGAPRAGNEFEVQLSLGSSGFQSAGLSRGTLRVTVWVRDDKDEEGDAQELLTQDDADGEGIGVGRLGELCDNALHHSYLDGTLDECLEFVTASATDGAGVDAEAGYANRYTDFSFGVIRGLSFSPLNNAGTGADDGEADDGEADEVEPE